MDEAVLACNGLNTDDRDRLKTVSAGLPLLADISRADVLLFCVGCEGRACILLHAQPHSVAAIYGRTLVGESWQLDQDPAVAAAVRQGRPVRRMLVKSAQGATLVEESAPVRGGDGRVIAAVLAQRTLLEHERDQRRSEYFRLARDTLREMVLDGRLPDPGHLTAFGEHDGLVFADNQQRILYVSHIASNLYSRLGYIGGLVGRRLEELQTRDAVLASRAIAQGVCLEEEVEEGSHIWIKKAIPLIGRRPIRAGILTKLRPAASQPFVVGVLLTIHDATDARQKEQQLKLKSAMLQEIQHRVRNSLQTLIALLRMEARRASSEEAQKVLHESISRILSVAAVHDSLVQGDSDVVNLRALSDHILGETKNSLVDQDQSIVFSLLGPEIQLPAEQATPCALVINELVLNALEHGGYAPDGSGHIDVILSDEADQVAIEIHNDGQELPEGFNVQRNGQLGLRLVRTLVEDGLGGKFEMRNQSGVSASVRFPKRSLVG